MQTKNKSGTLKCCVYDREKSWRESLGSICNQLTSFPIFPTFRSLDVTDEEAGTEYPELLENNLFTMSFLMSELCSKPGYSEDFFMNLFKHAKRVCQVFCVSDFESLGKPVSKFNGEAIESRFPIMDGHRPSFGDVVDRQVNDLKDGLIRRKNPMIARHFA
jgi:hypothetical protein